MIDKEGTVQALPGDRIHDSRRRQRSRRPMGVVNYHNVFSLHLQQTCDDRASQSLANNDVIKLAQNAL